MKRVLLFIISVLLVFSFVACKDNESESSVESSYDDRYEKLPEGFIISEKKDLLGNTKIAIDGEIYENYATASLVNTYIALGYDVEWTSATYAKISKGMVECYIDTDLGSLKYKGEDCILRAPGLETFVFEIKEKDFVLDETTMTYALTWTGHPCKISFSFDNKENGIVIEELYYDESVKEFDVNDYKEEIKTFSVSRFLSPIYNSTSLKNGAYEFWDIYFEEPILNEDTYKVYFDTKNSVWLVHGTLPEGAVGGVPYMIVKTDGTILAVWHT